MNNFCLFAGRHPLPGNPPALFSEFDFETFLPTETEDYTDFMGLLATGHEVRVYVTGLTPALSHLMFDVAGHLGELTLLHFDRDSGGYVEQKQK
jgi:hypothetical protein